MPFRHMAGTPGFLIHGFLIHGFWAGRESPILGVSSAPAVQKTIPEGGGRRPPPVGMVFGAAGAAQTPQNRRFPAGPKTMYQKHKCIAQT